MRKYNFIFQISRVDKKQLEKETHRSYDFKEVYDKESLWSDYARIEPACTMLHDIQEKKSRMFSLSMGKKAWVKKIYFVLGQTAMYCSVNIVDRLIWSIYRTTIWTL